jgi:magnesium transporter
MIQLHALAADGRLVRARYGEHEAESLEEWGRRLLPEEAEPADPGDRGEAAWPVIWLDLEKATQEQLAWLGKRFRFHPLALEDCLHFDQRPKIEDYVNHLFVVVHGLVLRTGTDVGILELHCFLSRNVVVTVHEEPLDPIRILAERVERDRMALPKQADFLLHRILDLVVDGIPRALTQFEEQIEALDDAVSQQVKPWQLDRIRAIRRRLGHVRRILAPQKEIHYVLARGSFPGISEAARVYFRDIYDHSVRVFESVDELREAVSELFDTYMAGSSLKTNETMKRLTVFSALFLPLSVITGFFGMNFEAIPWSSPKLFIAAMAVIGLLPVAMLAYFSRHRWLE